jgi:hypothetical protein
MREVRDIGRQASGRQHKAADLPCAPDSRAEAGVAHAPGWAEQLRGAREARDKGRGGIAWDSCQCDECA